MLTHATITTWNQIWEHLDSLINSSALDCQQQGMHYFSFKLTATGNALFLKASCLEDEPHWLVQNASTKYWKCDWKCNFFRKFS